MMAQILAIRFRMASPKSGTTASSGKIGKPLNEKPKTQTTHRPHSSSFLGFICESYNVIPKKGRTMGPMGSFRDVGIQLQELGSREAPCRRVFRASTGLSD